MPVIRQLSAIEVLDSRGKPTVKATCVLDDGVAASASVPSGASTGKAEMVELRDRDPHRYRGMGCRKAVANVNGVIADALRGRSIDHQSELDAALLALDGTSHKWNLGANAMLAVSIAFARAQAKANGRPLYAHFADMIGRPLTTLPRMTINLFSGGKHAGGQVPIQDVLLVPAAAKTIDEGLATVHSIYYAAADLTKEKYAQRPLKADEGGLAPPFPYTGSMFGDAQESIARAGYRLGGDVFLAVDVASSHFYSDGKYRVSANGPPETSDQMVNTLCAWVGRMSIVSLEDGLAEDDWETWPKLTKALAGMCIVVGDDFLCTNPARIRRAIDAGACNALLLKVNQIGTLTEAAEALKLARDAGWKVTVSARSGETEDDWLADLAVGWAGDQIKIGSITQSERLAKYNRLLEIEAETKLPVVEWPRE
ncbi:MAG TPA: enolase [Tepidisphaeraceae bacterium]|nr:enolase [Tepidisphaeraceae bacterium]